jgi:hypothetical protein
MKATGEVVELVGVEPECAIGCKVQGNDAYRRAPEDKRSYAAGMLPVGQSIQAVRHGRQVSESNRLPYDHKQPPT